MEINWTEDYRKEIETWREIAQTLSDYILMCDCYEASECGFDAELEAKALELVPMFCSKDKKEAREDRRQEAPRARRGR